MSRSQLDQSGFSFKVAYADTGISGSSAPLSSSDTTTTTTTTLPTTTTTTTLPTTTTTTTTLPTTTTTTTTLPTTTTTTKASTTTTTTTLPTTTTTTTTTTLPTTTLQGQSTTTLQGQTTTLQAQSTTTLPAQTTTLPAQTTTSYYIPVYIGPTGPTGYQGPSGSINNTGPTGPMGNRGDTGMAGPQGKIGETGPIGATGATGNQGNRGIPGVGIRGDTGNIGPPGPTGIGLIGPQGPVGLQGPSGNIGDTGNTGYAGISLTGQTGPSGLLGIQGPQGLQGLAGLSIEGLQGSTGIQGPVGIAGLMGPTGPQPPRGPTGIMGDTGPMGASTPGNALNYKGDFSINSVYSPGDVVKYFEEEKSAVTYLAGYYPLEKPSLFIFTEYNFDILPWHGGLWKSSTKSLANLNTPNMRGVYCPLVPASIGPTFYYKDNNGILQPLVIPAGTTNITSVPNYNKVYGICQGPITTSVSDTSYQLPSSYTDGTTIQTCFNTLQTSSWSTNSWTQIDGITSQTTRPFGPARMIDSTGNIVSFPGPLIFGPGIANATRVINGAILKQNTTTNVILWTLDSAIDLTAVQFNWLTGTNAPANTYRINHILPTPYADADSSLLGVAIPLTQAGGVVYDKMNGGYMSFNEIVQRYGKQKRLSVTPIRNPKRGGARKSIKKKHIKK